MKNYYIFQNRKIYSENSGVVLHFPNFFDVWLNKDSWTLTSASVFKL